MKWCLGLDTGLTWTGRSFLPAPAASTWVNTITHSKFQTTTQLRGLMWFPERFFSGFWPRFKLTDLNWSELISIPEVCVEFEWIDLERSEFLSNRVNWFQIEWTDLKSSGLISFLIRMNWKIEWI
jgi:hypothetical protein